MRKLVSAIALIRPWNCVITFISVWGGAIVAGHYLYSAHILAAAVSASLIAAYGNIINDIFDIEVDKINKPYRPLASGAVSRNLAVVIAIICLVLGNLLSHFVARYAFVLVSSVSVLLMIYTPYLKGRSYLGNIAVAIAASMAFIYGGIATANPLGAAILSGFALLIHLGREIVKDIEDREGDGASSCRTGAVANVTMARYFAIAVLAILIISTTLPYFVHIYSIRYFVIVLLGCDTLIALAILRLFQTDKAAEMRRVSLYLKLAMPLGLLAVLVG